jgi:hypothetical protein
MNNENNENNNISNDGYINIYDKVIFHNNIECEKNALIKDCLGINNSAAIELDLNTNKEQL